MTRNPLSTRNLTSTRKEHCRERHLYTTGPSCSRCRLSANLLKNSGVAFATIDIRTDPAARRYVTEELGYIEAPVVVVTDDPTGHLPHESDRTDKASPTISPFDPETRRHWSGFRPEHLLALVQLEGARPEQTQETSATS